LQRIVELMESRQLETPAPGGDTDTESD